jgi:hypothetical protein
MNPPTIFVMSENFSKKHNKRHGHGPYASMASNSSKDKKESFHEKP